MEPKFKAGDKVRIRYSAIFDVGSHLANTHWGPNRSFLTVRRPSDTVSGGFVVRGPSKNGLAKADQTIFGYFLELVEKVEPQGGKTCELFRLNQGAKFLGPKDRLMMKTDERDEDCIKSVILEGDFAGLISYVHPSREVKPLPGYEPEPDPWEEAKVEYGALEPGDLFRTDRDDSSDQVCVVSNKTDGFGDYFMMRNGALVIGFCRSQEVYRDEVLVEHGV